MVDEGRWRLLRRTSRSTGETDSEGEGELTLITGGGKATVCARTLGLGEAYVAPVFLLLEEGDLTSGC